MAVIVLLSTMSFTVEKHYCGDFLVDVSVIGNVEKCAMTADQATLVKSKDCCSDEVFHIEGQDELQKESFNKLTIEQQKLLVAYAFSYEFFFIESREILFSRNTPPPPDLNKDLQAFYQTFLI